MAFTTNERNMNSKTEQPNVLLVMADEHRWDCVGFNGNRQVKTPHLDALAADAVNYPNAICPYPVCTPSRYSLLSGIYVHQHAAWSNHCTLDPAIPTYAKALREAGYATKAVGKMHFTPTYLDVGFDEMELCEQDGDGRYDDDYHRALVENEVVDAIDLYDQRREYRQFAPQEYWETFGAMPSDLPEEWHSTTWIGDRAVETLESWKGGGNLLVASFVKPHHPFDPPQRWADMYEPAALDLLPGWTESVPPQDTEKAYFDNSKLTEIVLKRIMAYYYATISHIDHQVGRMIDVLKSHDFYDDAMVIYLSDHGEYMGFHHMILKQGHAYDPLARVPLLIKFPGNSRGGETSTTLANLIDVAPTVLGQAEVPTPDTMKGLDLADPDAGREIAFLENTGAGYYAARSNTHKLIWDRDPAKSQFFDLIADPHEIHDRIEDEALQPLVNEYLAAIARWVLFDSTPALRLSHSVPQIRQPNVPSAAQRDHLRTQIDRMAQSSLGTTT